MVAKLDRLKAATLLSSPVSCRRASRLSSPLGNPRLAEVRGKGVETNMTAAGEFAANVLPIILPMRTEGASLRKIAEALNARRIPTARGGTWAATRVADILRRAG